MEAGEKARPGIPFPAGIGLFQDAESGRGLQSWRAQGYRWCREKGVLALETAVLFEHLGSCVVYFVDNNSRDVIKD